MSYIPNRAMHRARPQQEQQGEAPRQRARGWLAAIERVSPRTWAAVAVTAGAVAVGALAGVRQR